MSWSGGAAGLPAGKLPVDLLRSLLSSNPIEDPAVVVGPGIGEDAAVLDVGADELLVAKTDPITLAGANPARYLLAVNSNDIAVMGGEPRWLLVTALLPEGIRASEVAKLFEEMRAACAELGVGLVGGHTEMTVGLDRPILVGCLLGTVRRDRLVRSSGARPGDVVLLAGGVALEGSAVLAREHAEELLRRGIPAAVIEAAASWIERPGISVLTAARLLNAEGQVHAMHDPTEGGLATALHELAEAAKVGLRIHLNAILVLEECRAICTALGLDPLGLLASGALLATMEPAAATAALERLRQAGLAAEIIGEVVSPEHGRILVLESGRCVPIPVFARDELARYLETSGLAARQAEP